MIENVIKVHFKSIADFQNRICKLWQDQKQHENYEFTFENEEVEKSFNELMNKFN
jgi:hypothetical protein